MTTPSDILQKIESFAGQAHQGQKRKYTPEPYIVHPVRVMKICREYTGELPVLAAALLHDVLEDTSVRAPEIHGFLREVLPEEQAAHCLRLVEELTDEYVKEKYPRFNRRERKKMERERIARSSPDAQTVKYADIIDNCGEIVTHDPDFARVFLAECKTLLRVMHGGNRELHRRAMETVESGLSRLYGSASR